MRADGQGSRVARPPLVVLSASLVSYIHTVFGLLAFTSALAIAIAYHYEKVVKNGIARWPDEWWPSVSATIGDWFPERNVFQVGIAFMSGPRILLVLLSALLVSLSTPKGSPRAAILATVGILRTFACAGWVYVTSSDDHDFHDIAMGAYLILTPPWMYITSGSLAPQPASAVSGGPADAASVDQDALAVKARRMRRLTAASFFSCIPFMVHFFYRHKFLEIKGAYSYYAYFEWGLIIFDLLFDAASVYDFSRLEIHIVEASRAVGSSGIAKTNSLLRGDWVLGGTAAAVAAGAWSTMPKDLDVGKLKRVSSSAHQSTSALRELVSFVSDIYLAFCGWTTITSLHAIIFFFSVYNMGVGGHEALLISPFLGLGLVLVVPSLRNAILSRTADGSTSVAMSPGTRILLRALPLVSILSYAFDSNLVRLLATGFANGVLAVQLAAEWGSAWENGSLGREAAVWSSGLLLSSIVKYANHSNNPLWPFLNHTNGRKHAGGLAVAAICLLETATRSSQHDDRGKVKRSVQASGSIAVPAAAFGTLIYAFHTFLSDSGTIIAWSWTGYPISGPTPVEHGFVLHLAFAASVLLTQVVPSLATSILFLLFGILSSALLVAIIDWPGFVGGVGLTLFLPALLPPLLQTAMGHHPLKVMLLAWLVANVLTFFNVLTVAYAFVPGAKIMRERTISMIVTQTLLLALGVWKARSVCLPTISRTGEASKRVLKLCFHVLVALLACSVSVPFLRHVPPSSITPHHAPERTLTAGIWTIHFMLDQNMRDSSRRISEVAKDLQLDILGLLESDLHRAVFGNRDATLWLAEELGYYVDIGPGPDKHTWGAALLSKFPILESNHHLLPSPNGELAPAIHAVLDIYGVRTHVIVSHNGQEEDPLDRQLQTEALAQILRNVYPEPALFLGYVVTKPHEERPGPYKILQEDGRMLDVEPTDLGRWCQYIFFRGMERIGYVRVSRYTVTDTELQTIKLLVPPVGAPISPDVDVRSRLVEPLETFEHPAHIYPAGDAWRYPTKFIDPPAMVYNKHKYSPHYYPRYYVRPE